MGNRKCFCSADREIIFDCVGDVRRALGRSTDSLFLQHKRPSAGLGYSLRFDLRMQPQREYMG